MNLLSSDPAFDWFSADAYLFDIDGTLLNTRDGVHYYAFRNALRDVFGVDANIDGVPVHGNTDLGILRAVLRRAGITDDEFTRGLPRAITQMCDEVLKNANALRVEVCASIPELLQRLRAGGKLLGIVSGNLEPIGWAKLEAAGLRRFFDFGSFSDDCEQREAIFGHGISEAKARAGADATVCIFGDTPSDIEAARRNGVPIVAVATGIFHREQLAQLQPDICIACCTDILRKS